ncbi:hypothetical protein EDE04_6935 [Streptomyces sp. 2132.2]|uniref:hypothetical protein n=1 Tax=Streptomyces sp. 2132.2 TaxID=2485161 RepID=UPI000FB7D807|nr:hypothetical protein [Streptomyces sp. 2132.2]ROR00369.1 hypothetical protein EDE04_6935 [Streptomyces sp. 2132.2]
MRRSVWGPFVLLLTVVLLHLVLPHDQPAAAQPPQPVAALAPAAPEVQPPGTAFAGIGHQEGGQGENGVMRGRAHTVPLPARAGMWAGSVVRHAALLPRLPEPGTFPGTGSPGSSRPSAAPDGEPTPAGLQTFRC